MKKAGLLVCPSRLAPQSAQRYRPADAQPWPAQPEGSAGSPASAGRLDGGGGPVIVHAQTSQQVPQGDRLGPSRGALLGCHAWSRTRLPDLPSGGLSSVVRLGPRLVFTAHIYGPTVEPSGVDNSPIPRVAHRVGECLHIEWGVLHDSPPRRSFSRNRSCSTC